MDVTLPDGTVLRGVPDGTSKAELTAKLKANGYDVSKLDAPAAPAPETGVDQFKAGLSNFVGKNALMGAVRGAAGIGATIMQPFQAAQDKLTGSSGTNAATRAGIEGGIAETGADPSSLPFKTGKLSAELAGTAGVGGALAAPLRSVSALAPISNALASSGFTTGQQVAPGLAAKAADVGLRTVGGAAAGGAQAGLVSPENAGAGAVIGGALPGALKAAGAVGTAAGNVAGDLAESAAQKLMNSALKPTLKQKQTGEAATAVQTLLDYGINPTKAGVEKLSALIGDLNSQISAAIGGSTARIDKANVVNALASTKQKFGAQVSPTADLNAIGGVENDFLNHPNLPGSDMSVQAAQDMKQGTYRVLKGKYGQMGSAETEAQKGLARGLKDEIAAAVPGVGPMNAEESRLIATLGVTERRALMDLNKNPLGLAALAIHEPMAFAAFMADKSAAFKSLAARALNTASQGGNGQVVNALAGPATYRALPLAEN